MFFNRKHLISLNTDIDWLINLSQEESLGIRNPVL